MSLFLNQENTRTKLQQKIAEDLAEKAKKKALDGETDRPDGVKDSAYLEGTRRTTIHVGFWLFLALIIVAVLLWLAVKTG